MTRIIYRRSARVGRRGRIEPVVAMPGQSTALVFLKDDHGTHRSVLDIRDATVFTRHLKPEPEGWSAVDLDMKHE